MKLKNITVRNFLAYGEKTVIPLDIPGLVLIVGENLDAEKASSNGASKSSIISAITYALWGETIYELKADEVIHNKVNKDCKVHLKIQDEHDLIEIIRTRGDTTAFKANDLILLKNDVNLSSSTNEGTQEKINNIIGMDLDIFKALNPGCGLNVATLTDKEIKILLEKILKTEELAVAHKLALNKYNEIGNTLANLGMQKIGGIGALLNMAESQRDDYQKKIESFEKDKQQDIDSITSQLQSLGNTDLGNKKQDLKELEKELYLVEDIITKKTKSKNQANLLYTKEKSKLDTELSLLDKKEKSFKDLKECPTCYSDVCSEHKEKILLDFSTQRNTLLSKLTKLGNNHSELSRKIELDLNKATSDRHILQIKISHLKEDINSITARLEKSEELTVQLEKVRSRVNDFQDLLQKVEENITKYNDELKELELKIASNTETYDIYKYWVDSFSPSGLRSYMLDTVIPFLNEKAEYYSNILTSGEMRVVFNTKTQQKSGKVVEKFNIEVSQKHGSNTFKGSSAGEKARANLVISLALGALASLRTSKKLSFRLFDEVFDCIDDKGCDAVCYLLTQCVNQYNSIYVITHKEEFQKVFDKKITVRKQGGFSTVIMEE